MIDALTPLQLAVSVAILALAFFIRGIAGFGSGLIAIPILTLMLPLSVVVPVMVLLDYIASLSHGLQNRTDIRWREILPLIPFSAAGVVIALFFLTQSDALLLTRALGVFIILFALYTLSGYTPKSGATRWWGGLAGLSGGMIGTLFGTGGPMYVTYFKARGLDKAAFRTTLAVTFIMDGAGRIVGFASTGFFNREFLVLIAMALPIVAIFMYIGGHVHTKITQLQFQRGISVLLILSGTVLLLKT
ncbi:MAG TPA: sulfite exporter TauE/SafE family protein [Gallionellaceae bacterium]|nr:sulfite exporter TauE/SafE family protein [Gallionellaceae bacterium]HQS76441.1 sulfite exporter TauE/SafE family protein [Gallionellaceae bacterium]